MVIPGWLLTVINMFPLLFGWLVVFRYVPQIHRCMKRRSAEDMSLVAAAEPVVENITCVVYGFCFATWTYVAACGLALVLATTQLIVVVYLKRLKGNVS